MLVLGIETSGRSGGTALVRDGKLIAEESLTRGLFHGRNLIPACKTLLEREALHPGDIDLIAVTSGPGSHTGLRVGLTAARTLGYALGKPCLGVNSLEALCCQAPAGSVAVVASLDARRNRIFGGVHQAGAWTHPPKLLTPQDLASAVPPGAFLTGSGATMLQGVLLDRTDLVLAPVDDRDVSAATVARIGSRMRHLAGKPEDLKAMYFQ